MSRIDTIGQNGNEGLHYMSIRELTRVIKLRLYSCALYYRNDCIQKYCITPEQNATLLRLARVLWSQT